MSKRKVIHSEGREMIAKVFHFLKGEYDFMRAHNDDKCDLSPLANVLERTANATGVSTRTVTRILKEVKEGPDTLTKYTQPMKRRRKKGSSSDGGGCQIKEEVKKEGSVRDGGVCQIKEEVKEEDSVSEEEALQIEVEVKKEDNVRDDGGVFQIKEEVKTEGSAHEGEALQIKVEFKNEKIDESDTD